MLFYAITTKWKVGYIFGGGLLFCVLVTVGFVTARFRRSNWLVRMSQTGLYVQFRSYLNYQLPPDEASVVFLGYDEISSARLVRESVTKADPMHSGATQTQKLRYVELELRGDIEPLASRLQSESGEKAPMRKHWYGSSSTLYCDYPVSLTNGSLLRIRWDVVPRAQKFLDRLRPYTVINDPVSLTEDFAHLQSLTADEQKQRLSELARRGDTVTAIYTARRLYGCGLAEAKTMVDRMREGSEIQSGRQRL